MANTEATTKPAATHSVTITTTDENTIQDIENFVSTLYQRGLEVTHETVMGSSTETGTTEEDDSSKSTRSSKRSY